MSRSDATTEPSVAIARKDKRDLILVGAAVTVAVIVVVALMIPPTARKHELTASLQPGVASLAAGRTIEIELSAWFDDRLIYPRNYDCEWRVSPDWLGTIDQPSGLKLQQKGERNDNVNFTAGRNVGAGNVTCIVIYEDRVAIAVANISVLPPALESAMMSPPNTQVLVNRSTTFGLIVHNSLGETMISYSADWTASGLDSSDYELNSTTGKSVRFLPKALANVTLNALVHSGEDTLSCNASVEVISVPPRSVNYRWYDMFNVSFGEWWQKRHAAMHLDYQDWMTETYPYLLEEHRGGYIVDTYSNMRLNITGRSLTEISMNDRPEFLPLLGVERGGNALINWYMQYLTSEQLAASYPSLSGFNDGWFVVLNGTVTLDKLAAFAVLDLTESGFESFANWWEANRLRTEINYTDWLEKEAGTSRLDIWSMYEWPLTILRWGLDAEKIDDQIVLRYDIVSWGMEALMTRWLHEAFLPTEWWFEDMRFNARIGPCLTDIDIDTAVQYAVKASKSTQTGQPCWMWEAMLQHAVPTFSGPPRPVPLSPYYLVNERYMDMGSWVLPWDPMPGGLPIVHTPGSFNLTAGERLRFEWPSANVKFITEPFKGDWTNFSGAITLGYSEPNQTDMPTDQYLLNLTARYLDFVGPFDFWSWSRDQTTHTYLADKWELFDLLPYGMPYLEFWAVP